ncbi:MAG: chloride channel protein, partial [Lewinella sp.]|nr:chloride channel protein [Lewinella sp.]
MSIMKGIRFLRLLFFRAIRWLSGRISSRNYQILVSIIIGIVAGLVAVVLKVLVHGVRDWLYGADPTSGRLAFVFLPALGIVLTLVYTRLILRRPIDSGLSNLIYAISKKRINIPVHETYSHVISSSLTVGFGGSVGLEAPIVRTGSAIGANLARLLGVGRRKQTLFLACGAAAGISAIFNSPVAGVIFAFEVLVTDIAIHSFIPLLISAATAAVVAKILYYEKIFFLPAGGWQIKALPFYLLLGVAAGLMSVYVSRATAWASELLNKRAQSFYWRVAVGSAALGLLIFLMPPLFGEGYDTVNKLLIGQESSLADHSLFYGLAGNPLFIFLFGVFILFGKAIATSVTIAAGGNGGKFAPTMFTGATLGFVFAYGI